MIMTTTTSPSTSLGMIQCLLGAPAMFVDNWRSGVFGYIYQDKLGPHRTYIQKAEVLEFRTPQTILIFGKVIY